MYVLGVDLGSTTGKAVVFDGEKVLGSAIIPDKRTPRETAEAVIAAALADSGLTDNASCAARVSTGYGRSEVEGFNKNVSEISCHARGAAWLHPGVRTLIDIGGQDCKVISVGKNGQVLDFTMNEKCAAGTGRFFESMCRVLSCTQDELSSWSQQSDNPATISSQCSVFAETEVVSLLNGGTPIEDIAAGINCSIASRVYKLVNRVGMFPDVVMTGGCSKNSGLVERLEQKLGMPIASLPEDPQLVGAIGAALFAWDNVQKEKP
jgi:predicted CoA-substrate-specific enzyme activase